MSDFKEAKERWESHDNWKYAERAAERKFFFNYNKDSHRASIDKLAVLAEENFEQTVKAQEEINQLRTEVEKLKKERWQVVATRNAALNTVEQLRFSLALATDAANKGDKARDVAQALTDECEELREEVKLLKDNLNSKPRKEGR